MTPLTIYLTARGTFFVIGCVGLAVAMHKVHKREQELSSIERIADDIYSMLSSWCYDGQKLSRPEIWGYYPHLPRAWILQVIDTMVEKRYLWRKNPNSWHFYYQSQKKY